MLYSTISFPKPFHGGEYHAAAAFADQDIHIVHRTHDFPFFVMRDHLGCFLRAVCPGYHIPTYIFFPQEKVGKDGLNNTGVLRKSQILFHHPAFHSVCPNSDTTPITRCLQHAHRRSIIEFPKRIGILIGFCAKMQSLLGIGIVHYCPTRGIKRLFQRFFREGDEAEISCEQVRRFQSTDQAMIVPLDAILGNRIITFAHNPGKPPSIVRQLHIPCHEGITAEIKDDFVFSCMKFVHTCAFWQYG